jgi:hypothetical protein
MKNNGQWAWFDAGAMAERQRILELVKEYNFENTPVKDDTNSLITLIMGK